MTPPNSRVDSSSALCRHTSHIGLFSAIMNFVTFVREFWTFSFLPAGMLIGWYFDRRYEEKLSIFRHKSKLFQGELEPKKEES
ncbi:NADH dehydrogenase [ubiquinone] 1 beta subcomplex subunit 1 [Rana temporaria]|uniref:NADH dehydrogenase [ubiquinone] 1 beta subcomplex subunit 1 n=1 Tax=Rana temporaria TaxID=8407 RepID=UPI001AAC9999|nr:NADH dehydrogenase [ubiquinone] 1 beta subcomplex subunit 1 [Rana temporaria]